jgi:predicted XRE-type DNA-binding protein
MIDDTEVTPSSGNVFADLGFDNPEEELMKAKLVRELRAIVKRRPDVSALVVGRTGKFSIDRLVRCLDKLDDRVDVVVRHKPRVGRSSTAAVA